MHKTNMVKILTGNMDAGPILQNRSNYFISIPSKAKRISDNKKINFILSPTTLKASRTANPSD